MIIIALVIVDIVIIIVIVAEYSKLLGPSPIVKPASSLYHASLGCCSQP